LFPAERAPGVPGRLSPAEFAEKRRIRLKFFICENQEDLRETLFTYRGKRNAERSEASRRQFDKPRQRFYVPPAFRHPPHLAMERVPQRMVRGFIQARKTFFAKGRKLLIFTPPKKMYLLHLNTVYF
jgi:hypothetical protein